MTSIEIRYLRNLSPLDPQFKMTGIFTYRHFSLGNIPVLNGRVAVVTVSSLSLYLGLPI